ncbi:MAG TPA: hypothetical protein VMR86_16790 [Myxococcota bacterium]|nr:hypothetical protein [Myxococcota bacterium]
MLVVPKVESDDVQSLLFAAYPKHGASFHLLWVKDPNDRARAGRQLAELPITFGEHDPDPDPAAQIAFTAEGLKALGVDDEVLAGFSRPFQEGMKGAMRARVLGDVGGNAPDQWHWGLPDVPHAVLLVYSLKDASARARELLQHLDGWKSLPLPEPVNLRASGRPHLKEHFGFDDGIANPFLRGHGKGEEHQLPHNIVAPGEFILGYLNEAGRIPLSPHVSAGGRGGHVLPNGDFGRNGSYLVFRELEQHVRAFWSFMLKHSQDKPMEAIRLASKMVGRWPNGSPMTIWSNNPAADADPRSNKNDEFLYAADPDGLGCPIGAHIRRANPRDSVPQLDPAKSIETSKQRRILRRGRAYGPALAGVFENPFPDPAAIRDTRDPDGGRGLHFLCFVADLERQYEFIQQTWVNSRKFAGLGNDSDPLLSNPCLPPDQPAKASDFVIQRDSLNQRITGLEQFITVRGSAYFFMPGQRAIQYLAGL